jgi:hypothetical protein
MPGAQVGLGLPGVTGLGAALAWADIESVLATPAESVLVFVAVSVVVWLLQAASRPRAAIGAAQRAEALFQNWNMKRKKYI